jgi:hypothetical protein
VTSNLKKYYEDFASLILREKVVLKDEDFDSFWTHGGEYSREFKGYKFDALGKTFLVVWNRSNQEFHLYEIRFYKRLLFGRNKNWVNMRRIKQLLDLLKV